MRKKTLRGFGKISFATMLADALRHNSVSCDVSLALKRLDYILRQVRIKACLNVQTMRKGPLIAVQKDGLVGDYSLLPALACGLRTFLYMKTTTQLELLENLYGRYSRRELSAQDPVHFLEAYEDVRDREVVAMIASALAYGRVAHIIKSVSLVLDRMGAPNEFLRASTPKTLARTFADFRHRFASGAHLAELLSGIRHVIEKHGSLEACFSSAMRPEFTTIAPAMGPFVAELRAGMGDDCGHLLPVPENGSACKRLALFMRWMIRCDAVDMGGWTCTHASRLIIPLDTHMNRIGQALALTARKSPNMRAALEITDALRAFAPDDPVKYDFALMRLSMDSGDRLQQFVDAWQRSKDKAHA